MGSQEMRRLIMYTILNYRGKLILSLLIFFWFLENQACEKTALGSKEVLERSWNRSMTNEYLFAEYIHKNTTSKVADKYLEIFNKKDKDLLRYFALAKQLRLEGRNAQSIRALTDLIKQHSRLPELYYELGLVSVKKEKYRAIFYFKNAIKIDPLFHPAYVELSKIAETEKERGEFKKISDCLTNGCLDLGENKLKEDKANSLLLYDFLRARRYAKKNNSGDAKKILMRLSENNPMLSEPQYELGLLLLASKKEEEALCCFKKTINCNPLFLPAYIELAKKSITEKERKKYCVKGLLLAEKGSLQAIELLELLKNDSFK